MKKLNPENSTIKLSSIEPRIMRILALISALLILVLAAMHSPVSTASAGAKETGAQPNCDPSWIVVPSPNVATIINQLFAVSVVSANDIWAVGFSQSSGQPAHTLIEHWNGLGWNIVSSPNVGIHGNSLRDVTAIAPNDVWAVGNYDDGSIDRTLTLHYNGTAWSIVNSPNNSTYDNDLLGVSSSSGEVWAVGYLTNSLGNERTLAMRWDGSAWTIVATPNVNILGNYLLSVTVISPNDIWAVGFYEYSTSPFVLKTLTQHWDGTSWSNVTSPNLGTDLNQLSSVAAVSSGEIWAVGVYQNSANPQPMAMLWNGSSWNLISTPNVGSGNAGLLSVAARASNDVWTVGLYTDGTAARSLIEHWDGSAWTQVTSPNPGYPTLLYDLAFVSQNDIWAVGTGSDDATTLTERYNPCSASPTPTTIPTSSPTTIPTSAATGTPGGQASPTPTQCSIEFTDVPQGSTFYSNVRCMSCRGIINGYASGCDTGNPCFRPTSNVTRGQLSKIVANAAGFNEPAASQQFEDVPVGSTFYDFVWRLANRNIVGGYACGGSGEPCVAPANLPYFRPNGNATRGQISKIVSNAANFADPPGAQLFEDVPASHTFFDFIQRLANRQVMNGYACGGSGEPCVAPANLPYFRPSANATRGQTAKIVANAFFPDCFTPQK